YYFFVPKDFSLEKEYTQGFKINEMFTLSSSGVESAKDNFIIKFTRKDTEKLKNFVELHDIKEIAKEYKVNNEKAQQVKNDFPNIVDNLSKILYRPFDIRFTLYSPNSQGIWWRPRYEVMRHL